MEPPKTLLDRQVPRKPHLLGGVKGHNINEISFPGSTALWAGSFKPRVAVLIKGLILRGENDSHQERLGYFG